MVEKKKIRFSKIYKKWYVLLLSSLAVTIILAFISSSSFFQETEMKLIDYRFRLDPVPENADSNVVIVAIDDGSLNFFKDNGVSWPWPRSFYGYMVDYFTAAGSKAVIFDMQFYEPDIDREETYAEETDGMFAKAIENNGNVYLGTQLLLDSTYIHPELTKFSIPLEEKKLYKYNGVRAPIDPFIQAARFIGIINSSPDGDGVIRRVSMLYRLNEDIFTQMAFCVWLNQQDETGKVKISDRNIKINEIEIPIDKNGKYLLNWYGIEPFTTYPFRAVIASASAAASGNEPILPLKIFKDKHIIIGATAAGLMDLKTNPYSKIMPGMEIWATALSNYLNRDFSFHLEILKGNNDTVLGPFPSINATTFVNSSTITLQHREVWISSAFNVSFSQAGANQTIIAELWEVPSAGIRRFYDVVYVRLNITS